MLLDAFRPSSQATVTLTSGAVAVASLLPSGEYFEVQNTGTGTVFFDTGPASVVAVAATGTPVLPGAMRRFRRPQGLTHISVIAPTGGGTVYVTGGVGDAIRTRGRGGKAAGPSGPVAIFDAPLTTTLVPTRAGDPTFTFTRATTAYVADNEGILRNAISGEARFQGARRVRNLERFTANMNNAAWGVFGGATKGAGTVIFPADPNALVAQVTDTLSTGTASKLICVSMTVAVAAGTGQFRINNTHSAAVGYLSPDLIASTTPQRFAFTQQYTNAAGNGAVNAGIQNGSGGAAATFIVSNIQVEDVTGQSNTAPGEYVSCDVLAAPYHGNGVDGTKYFATVNGNSVAANIVTEAAGTAIPAATLLGYVAENQATNLCLQSQTFDTTWTTASASITPNTQVAPDGTTTADTLTDAAGNTQHKVSQSGIAVSTVPFTASVYVKSGTLPWVQLLSSATGNAFANFNLATGAVGSINGANMIGTSAVALPNGWWRLSMTWLPTGSGGSSFAILGLNADINTFNAAYNGTGTGTLYLWGAQVEAASQASSYIPTAAVSVTRNGDLLSYPMVGNLDGALATTYTEAITAASPSSHQILLSTSTGFYPQYYDVGTRKLAIYSAAAQPMTANARTLGVVNKNAVAWSGATVSLCLNGGAIGAGAFTAYATSGSIRIGTDNAVGIQGSIRNVRFYATWLTDPQLIAMTS